MTTATLDPAIPVPESRAHRRGELAAAFQEALTVAVRLRSNRQVAADAASFRVHIKHLLATADQEARRAGYDGTLVRLALYAYIAFLDESVLNSAQPMFAEWPRQPLQEEIFGDHVAGETFFRYLEDLVGRQDSEDLADVLEVYLLCLLLGFRGRYGAGDPAGLQALIRTVQDKVQRCRGGQAEFSPAWALPAGEMIAAARDPWIRRLGIFAGAAAAVAAVLYLAFRVSLHAGSAELGELVSRLVS